MYLGIGVWIREKLEEAGSSGLTATDVHQELKHLFRTGQTATLGIPYRGGRYASFSRYWLRLAQLRYIEPSGEVETSYQKGGVIELRVPRRYYRLTSTGRSASVYEWANPLAVSNPEWGPSGEKKLEYMARWSAIHRRYPTRGRPRRERAEEPEEEGEEEGEEEE